MIFETERLELRELVLDDAKDLFAILSDQETMQYYPRPYSLEKAADWIRRSTQSYQENQYGLWALVLKSEKKFIGQCGILKIDIDGHPVPEIGYHVNKQYWNKGLATEAAGKCLEYGFDVLALEEIFIHTYVKNVPSRRVAEKLRMQIRKEWDKKVDPSGRIMRHVVFSMKKDEY